MPKFHAPWPTDMGNTHAWLAVRPGAAVMPASLSRPSFLDDDSDRLRRVLDRIAAPLRRKPRAAFVDPDDLLFAERDAAASIGGRDAAATDEPRAPSLPDVRTTSDADSTASARRGPLAQERSRDRPADARWIELRADARWIFKRVAPVAPWQVASDACARSHVCRSTVAALASVPIVWTLLGASPAALLLTAGGVGMGAMVGWICWYWPDEA